MKISEIPSVVHKDLYPLFILPSLLAKRLTEGRNGLPLTPIPAEELKVLQDFEGARMCEQLRKIDSDTKCKDIVGFIENNIKTLNTLLADVAVDVSFSQNPITLEGIKDMQASSYFTPQPIVNFMVDLIIKDLKMPKDAMILEPSCGNGVFMKPFIEAGYKNVLGLEPDTLTYLISSLANDNLVKTPFNTFGNDDDLSISIHNIKSFEGLPSKCFDLCIGNPPYANVKDKFYDKELMLADSFIVKSVDALKENGVSIQIVSSKVMDKPEGKAYGSDIKEYLRHETELLGAVRVPPAFYNAGITTDILVFRKCMEHERGKMDDRWAQSHFLQIENEKFPQLTSHKGISEYYTSAYFLRQYPDNVMGYLEITKNLNPKDFRKFMGDIAGLELTQKKQLEMGAKPKPEYVLYQKNAKGKICKIFNFEKYVKDKNLSLKQFMHGDLQKTFKNTETLTANKGRGR